MSWNHRVMAHCHEDRIYFQIHEVYYTDSIPDGYKADAITVGGDDLKEIEITLQRIKNALKKPVLWAGKDFPKECKVKYTCDTCGRNNFDKPSPHKCNGTFRKTGLTWSVNCI